MNTDKYRYGFKTLILVGIDKNIPIPSIKQNRIIYNVSKKQYSYPWKLMDIGDSFLIVKIWVESFSFIKGDADKYEINSSPLRI